jgi:hypothetical protein
MVVVSEFLTVVDRRTENVRVVTMVVAELKFGNVQRHILGADLAERANGTALEKLTRSLQSCWCGPPQRRIVSHCA